MRSMFLKKNLFLLTIFFFISCGSVYTGKSAQEIIYLGPKQVAIFGYGSLVSKASMEKSLKRPYYGTISFVTLKDYQRTWNVQMPNTGTHQYFYMENEKGEKVFPDNILYLNLEPHVGDKVAGALFVVNEADLKGFDEREWIYNRTEITDLIDEVKLVGGKAYTYVAKPEYKVNPFAIDSFKQAAIRETYLNYLKDSFKNTVDSYEGAYLRTTQAYPSKLVIQDKKDESKKSNPFGYKEKK